MMSLSHKQWENMSQEERRAWNKAAEEKGPHFIGGVTLSGRDFHQQLMDEKLRREKRNQTY